MAKNDTKVTDNPKLKQKRLSDGNISLYLEYYLGSAPVYDEVTGKTAIKIGRRKEFLSMYLWGSPKSPQQRQENKDTLETAKKIRAEKEQEHLEHKHGYRVRRKDVNILTYFQAYIDAYTKRDLRNMQQAQRRFTDFLKEKYPIYASSIKPEQMTKEMMTYFVEYLQSKSAGDGAKSIYQRFKKFINYAIENDILLKNPCAGVVCKSDEQTLRKDVLSIEEVQQLAATTYPGQNPEIRRAFIFCLYTGIRFCDVVDLKFDNVDYSNRLLRFEQLKTRGHSASSGVVIPLNDGLLSLIGESSTDDLIFNLPSNTACLKTLRHWTKRAGIAKHITWHCARHSFAVNILNAGANIKTLASLLGHSGLKHTEKYTRAVDSLKEAAINSLPALKF